MVWQIMGIWIAVSLPIAILGWIVAPALSPDIAVNPLGAAATRVGFITMGLIW
jgi:hypothetical protein